MNQPHGWSTARIAKVALALLLAAGLSAYASANSPLGRLSNLDLSIGDIPDPSTGNFPHTYIEFSKTTPGSCIFGNRKLAISRRSDLPANQARWRYGTFGNPETPHWLLRSKKDGFALFTPVADVSDFVYPFLYGKVREACPELHLPECDWTQLFVNRMYVGLYLKTFFEIEPGRRAKNYELLDIEGGTAAGVNVQFDADGDLLGDAVSEGKFPVPQEPVHPALRWLSRLRDQSRVTLLLDDRNMSRGDVLPLPVDVRGIHRLRLGRGIELTIDERLKVWNDAVSIETPIGTVFSDDERQQLRADLETFMKEMDLAMQVHAVIHAAPGYGALLERKREHYRRVASTLER
ncbi:MAG: hypothetical protein HUU29_00360 [Planctomycetaceae bacterium]|nr:hypothetical protein [Planctomycetaceae bacterium]